MSARSHSGRGHSLWLTAWVLTLQPPPAPAADLAASAILTNAAQVRALTAEEAARHLAVRLRGVFLGQTGAGDMGFVIADATEGIYLQAPPGLESVFRLGDVVEAEGVTDPGGFAPFVRARSVQRLGQGEIPPPRQASIGELSNGGLDAQWVAVSGVVRSCEPMSESDRPPPPPGSVLASNAAGSWVERKFKMTLASGSERLKVQVNDELVPRLYVDAEVRLEGICFSQHNTSRQFLNPLLLVPHGVKIVVQKPPGSDPFALAVQPVASLLEFDRRANFGHRVHLRGLVTHARPGEALWLRDGDRGLRVFSTEGEALLAGDEVDVVGFPVGGQYTPVLEDAVYRKTAARPPPVAITLTTTRAALKHDADFVQLQAVLVQQRPIKDGCILTLDWNGLPVEAALRLQPNFSVPANWLPNSLVSVAGICVVVAAKGGPVSGIWEPRSFQLLLRSPEDLSILRGPSWWTHQHIVLSLAVVAGASLLAVGLVMWIAAAVARAGQPPGHGRG